MFGACGRDKCGGGSKKNSKSKSAKGDSVQFEQLINKTYRIGRKIGAGSFGQIRVGTNINDSKQTVAIKMEKMGHDAQLQTEYSVYGLLKGKKGFPHIFYFGRYLNDYQVLVMEMLGRDLESCYEKCNRRFSLKTMIFITLQLLKRFETLHEVGILYRDVKPENFMIGINTNTVYVIDFGLSKQYMEKGQHIPAGSTHELIGTSRYMSVQAHLAKELSRRDDLEALCYVFAYFLRGQLPWSGLKAENFKKHNMMICETKQSWAAKDLFDGHPVEYITLLDYARSLDFEANPNYERLRDMFKRLFHVNNFVDDGVFDWNH